MLLLATFDLAAADVALFDEYEAAVLPLMDRHGGRLRFRVRSLDRESETHLVEFPDEEAFAAYRDDPDRQALQHLFERSRAVGRVTPVTEL
jgi:uncharacterized protein (DUF1330 family)